LRLTAIDDDTLSDGYARIGDAVDISLTAPDGTPTAGEYTVTITINDFNENMTLHVWNAATGEWQFLPANVDVAMQRLQATLDRSARLALLQSESFAEHQILLPAIFR
jgi:hypothetical protein